MTGTMHSEDHDRQETVRRLVGPEPMHVTVCMHCATVQSYGRGICFACNSPAVGSIEMVPKWLHQELALSKETVRQLYQGQYEALQRALVGLSESTDPQVVAVSEDLQRWLGVPISESVEDHV